MYKQVLLESWNISVKNAIVNYKHSFSKQYLIILLILNVMAYYWTLLQNCHTSTHDCAHILYKWN
jgi:hypothetical protein